MVRLAIDTDSGDFGSAVIIAGVLEAFCRCEKNVEVYFCGNRKGIEKELSALGDLAETFRDRIHIVHCKERVSQNELRRTRLWKHKQDAAIIRCISLQKEGVVDASISAGDTGILLGASIFILGRHLGVARPALGALLPTVKKNPVLLLDVGANLSCRKEHLISFARLGRKYVKAIAGIKAPRVALLNIGSEPIKGTGLIGEVGKILGKSRLGYTGFIEGNRIISGDADVVVCDGFAGNVLLKAFESFHQLTAVMLGNEKGLLEQIGKHLKDLDPENYGAVPFLGIKGIVFKAHGRSSSRAIASAVCSAERIVRINVKKALF